MQPSEPASNHEATLLTESAPPDYQQRITELEKQVQLLNQRVDTLDKELEQKVGLRTQEVESLKESITSLERELETLPSGTSSDIEARIEELREQIDGLNAEVAAINEELAEQDTMEETLTTTPTPTSGEPSGYSFKFSGRGNSSSAPFQVREKGNKIVVDKIKAGGSPQFTVLICKAPMEECVQVYSGSLNIGRYETYVHLDTGESFMRVIADSNVWWTIYVIPQ